VAEKVEKKEKGNANFITKEELREAVEALGYELTPDDIKSMDKDEIKYEDFFALMHAKMSEKETQQEMMKVFKLFTGSDSKVINFATLKKNSPRSRRKDI